jgi:predicted secreted hydrolase
MSDITANQFYTRERLSRGAVGLAGAEFSETDPRVRIWIEDWTMTSEDAHAKSMHLQAAEGPIAIDLITREAKPPTLQGDHGLSAKGPEPGSASYYYSLTSLITEGTITVNGKQYRVSGSAWKDHEFSTRAISRDTIGWDWFALQLDNQREIMLYQIRNKDGNIVPTSHGSVINADGSVIHLSLKDFKIEALDRWTSPHTGAIYPARWRISIQTPDGPITLEITPLMPDQELNSATAYWEGASRITGTDNGKPVQGYGYVELTGYNRTPDQAEPQTRQG